MRSTHECPSCHKVWHCDGCEILEDEHLCGECRIEYEELSERIKKEIPIIKSLLEYRSIVFPIDTKTSSFTAFLCMMDKKIEPIYQGGRPSEYSAMFGIARIGFFWFDINKHISPDYLSEKMNLPESDAIHVANLLNEVFREVYRCRDQSDKLKGLK